jgi:fused signal recognition particle receptor
MAWMFWRRTRPAADPADTGGEPTLDRAAITAGAAGTAESPEVADPAVPAERATLTEPAATVDPAGAGEPAATVHPAGATEPADADSTSPATIDAGLQASRRGFMARLHDLFRGGTIGEETWEEIEETLIAGDVGARLAMSVVERARARRDPDGAEAAVRAELELLLPAQRPGPWRPARPVPSSPAVILVVGVNGTGKTTSIAKIAARLTAEGDRVILAAADTFRAAAIEQLEEWARRLRLPVVAHKAGADPAAVVFDALDAALARGADAVIVDTAGRLHTRHNLMEELIKIRRTIDRRLPGVTPEVLFVLDATTGQNGLAQARAFHEATGLTGIVLTKLDSTAKGGIVFAIEQALGVPVVFAGVGERVGDLVDFEPHRFVEALFA